MSYGPGAKGDRHSGWALDEEDSRPFIKAALAKGINFFDTSNIYGLGESEEILGRAIKDFADRDKVVIATKVFAPLQQDVNALGLSRKAIHLAVDASLKRLQTDYIDLYQAHSWDTTTPIEETLEAFHDLIKAGKVRYIGACNFYAWQLAKALYTADLNGWTRFVSIQSQYNLVYREDEREIHAFARDQGLGILPWSPMARGFLAGSRRRDGTAHTARAISDPWGEQLYGQPHDFQVAERLSEVAAARGEKPIKVALAWVASKPGITAPIIGATKPGHLEDAVSALSIELTKEEIELLEQPYRPRSPWSLTA
jgi:aryl-alcohol dehydrogenase (NADP+)